MDPLYANSSKSGSKRPAKDPKSGGNFMYEQTRRAVCLAVLALGAAFALPARAQEQRAFSAWGWPQPYDQISAKSVTWLKEKGWWPVAFAWQAPFSGQNTINVVLSKTDFLAK